MLEIEDCQGKKIARLTVLHRGHAHLLFVHDIYRIDDMKQAITMKSGSYKYGYR